MIYQDDTHGRLVSLSAENHQADTTAEGDAQTRSRTGMDPTGLVVQQGARTICLYCAGRAPAGEHLDALWAQRDAGRAKPLVMSDALASNAADEGLLIRCHCLAHGRRKCVELEEVFPHECAAVITALKQVFDPDEEAHERQRSAVERLAYHQQYSGPIRAGLKPWLETQCANRAVQPKSS